MTINGVPRDPGLKHPKPTINTNTPKQNFRYIPMQKQFEMSTHADGVLAPGSAHARPSARPPLYMSGNFPANVSAESPSNIFPKP